MADLSLLGEVDILVLCEVKPDYFLVGQPISSKLLCKAHLIRIETLGALGLFLLVAGRLSLLHLGILDNCAGVRDGECPRIKRYGRFVGLGAALPIART